MRIAVFGLVEGESDRTARVGLARILAAALRESESHPC